MAIHESNNASDDFEAEAHAGRIGVFGEFWYFLKHNRKWWMTPLLILLALIAVLIILGGTGAAPFIYTLF